MRTREEIEFAFTYHAPRNDSEIAFYQEYRAQALRLALWLEQQLPETPERTIALRHLHDAVMQGNMACALHGTND